jgi:hypothetical protein
MVGRRNATCNTEEKGGKRLRGVNNNNTKRKGFKLMEKKAERFGFAAKGRVFVQA